MNIKVCGITQLQQLQQLDEMEVDFAGLIFCKESQRYAGDKVLKNDLRNADFDLKKVGVFVNSNFDEIIKIVDDYQLDIVQLHGDEMPSLCRKLSEKTEVIKAFRISADEKNIDELVKKYDDACDYYLFDTGGPKESLGGTGLQFNWELLTNSRIEKPFFLSGGIGLVDAARIKMFNHPDFFAVDINSKFEISPGVKDMEMVKMFRQLLRD